MKPRVMLTSFPAFGGHQDNVSMKVMNAIESIGVTGITLVTELLTCDEIGSRRVSESINQGEKFNAIIHLGLAESRKVISLERWAHNESYFRIADNSGRLVNGIVIDGAPSKLSLIHI